jgi:hypothetical protein
VWRAQDIGAIISVRIVGHWSPGAFVGADAEANVMIYDPHKVATAAWSARAVRTSRL